MSEAPANTLLVSTADAARAIGVDRSTLTRWAISGRVTPTQRTVGGHMRWDLTNLRAQLDAIGATTPPPHG